jgi:hypothetical protein
VIALVLWSCSSEAPTSGVVPGTVPAPRPEPTEPTVPEPPLPAVCDAGDAAWVARTLPLALGRRAHGSDEARLWREVAATWGRDVAVRAMARTPAGQAAWTDWFEDELFVARTGDKEFGSCFRTARLPDQGGDLAGWLRDTPPTALYPRGTFSMADVLQDAIAADDVSVIHRTYLFARMARPTVGANVSAEELEYNARVNFGELFLQTYLHRNNTCMACHNSEYSVTPDTTFPLPGLVEKAVFGASSGLVVVDAAHAMFAVDGVVRDPRVRIEDRQLVVTYPGFEPWGMSGACGSFWDPADRVAEPDWLGQDERFLVGPYGSDGSVWDVESRLRAGMEGLRGQGLVVGDDGSVDGDQALAWLVAMHLADRVWTQAVGAPLTIAHGFPRNEGQQQILGRLTRALVDRWSLADLLVAVTAEPAFNPGTSCGADPYGLPAVYDPWTTTAAPGQEGNGPGDAVHALPPRALLRSAHDALGWPAPPEWRLEGEEETVLAAIGVFLRESQPGFAGSDFQGFLEFEAAYGACVHPFGAAPNDLIDALVASAPERVATAGDLAGVVRDRLLHDAAMDTREVELLEVLLGVPLDTPAAEVPALREGLGAYCGALLLSPGFWLATEARLGTVAPTWSSVEADCLVVADGVQRTARGAQCEAGRLSFPGAP